MSYGVYRPATSPGYAPGYAWNTAVAAPAVAASNVVGSAGTAAADIVGAPVAAATDIVAARVAAATGIVGGLFGATALVSPYNCAYRYPSAAYPGPIARPTAIMARATPRRPIRTVTATDILSKYPPAKPGL